MSLRTLSLALTTGTALAVTACGSIDATKVEDAARQKIASSAGANVRSVECPDDVEVRRGRNFVCTAVGDDGTRAPVRVTQRDDSGNVVFQWSLLRTNVVEDGLRRFFERAAKAGGRRSAAAVRCPELIGLKRGQVTRCSFTFDNGSKRVGVATQKDDQGSLEFDLR